MELRKFSNVKAASQKTWHVVKINDGSLKKDEGNVPEISRKGRGRNNINKRHKNNRVLLSESCIITQKTLNSQNFIEKYYLELLF